MGGSAIRSGSRAALAALAACALGCVFGPRQLEWGHLAYNSAVKSAADDELLLNIVRIRYLDTLDFMATTSISSQLAFTVAGNAGSSGEFGTFGGGDLSYSSRPTFTFSPQRGQDFAQRLIEPVRVDVLAYLVAADWDVRMLMRLFVRRLNGLDNELGLPSPEFVEVTDRLSELQIHNRLFLGFVQATEPVSGPIGAGRVSGTDIVEAAKAGYRFQQQAQGGPFVLTANRPQPVLAVEGEGEDAKAVRRLLQLERGRPYYELEPGTRLGPSGAGLRDAVTVRTGSLLRAVIYLSQGVQVPPKHVEEGLTSAEWPPGSPGAGIEDLFTVRVAKRKPGAELRVKHRGYWFYIAETDLSSRYTFFHMSEAFRLGLTPVASQESPVLTLPVGGP